MKRDSIRRLIYIFLLTPFFTPAIFGVLPGTELAETVFDLWRLASAGLICLGYLHAMVKKGLRPSAVLVCMGLYLLAVAVSTVLHGSNYWFLIKYVVTIGCFCLLLELTLRDDPLMTLDMLFYPLTVLILANLMLLCIYPFGLCVGGTYWYNYNFMGIDNFMGAILVPYIILTALRAEMRYGDLDWSAYLCIGMAALSLLLIWSATALIGMAIVLLFLLFFHHRRLQFLFNGISAMLLNAAMFFGIVLLRLQNIFAFFIEDVLHKGLSFTGRTDIWDTAIRDILASPLIGYGVTQYGKVYRLAKHKYYHAHNAILEVLMEGGLLALIPYLLMLGLSVNRLMQNFRHSCACLISAGLLACAAMTCMEPFLDSNGLLIYALIFLGYHVEKLIDRCAVPARVSSGSGSR